MSATGAVALGILAGGRGERLGGAAKAWLERDGMPQVLRLARRFESQVDELLVSANPVPGPESGRYASLGLNVVRDARAHGIGPLAGIEALAAACTSSWLLTLPVDLVDVNDCLLPSLRAAADGVGAWVEDDDGDQPLVALYRVASLRDAVAEAMTRADYAPRHLQARLGMNRVRLHGVRLGNLNTPEDLAEAGVRRP